MLLTIVCGIDLRLLKSFNFDQRWSHHICKKICVIFHNDLPDRGVAIFKVQFCKGMTGDMAASMEETTGVLLSITPFLTRLGTPLWLPCPFTDLLPLPFHFPWPLFIDRGVFCAESESQSSSFSLTLRTLENSRWSLLEEPFCESIFLDLLCCSESGDCRERFLPATGVCWSDGASEDNLWPSNSFRTKKVEGCIGLLEYSTWKAKYSTLKVVQQLLDFNILPTAHGRLGTIKVDVAKDEQTYPRTPNKKTIPKIRKKWS